MQKKNSYDEIKGMLKTLRTLNESKPSFKVLKEEETPMNNMGGNEDVKDDIIVINNVEVNISSEDSEDMKLEENQKTAISALIDSFREQVSQIVDFEPGMTVKETQIRLDGTLTDNDISFVMIAGEEGGLYVNADMLKIEQEEIDTLNKLLKFEKTYKDAMEPLITERQNN
jgi:hypothetical protein